MSELLIVCPSRLRPHAVHPLARALADTCTADTYLLWCVDDPDDFDWYSSQMDAARSVFPAQGLVGADERLGFIGCLNRYATAAVTGTDPPYAIASLGDDHRPETVGWDSTYLAALRRLRTGIVYGDDGFQGANLPTQMAMTVDIVAALGYVAPPQLWHMYCDNFWLDLGTAAGCITYLPDVAVTHHHPGTGNGVWDDSYRESNSFDRYAQDEAAYRLFREQGHLADDIVTVTALRGARP